MKRYALFAGALFCLALLFSPACTLEGKAPADEGKIHVGIVFDIGGKDDRSFNAAAWEGVKRAARDFPIVLRDVEPGIPTSIEPAMRAFAESGYDVIIAVGFAQAPILERVARDFPNVNFAIVDGVIDYSNVASLLFKEHEGSYLVGMIAAKTSQSGTVGFIGGMDIPLIHRFQVGYQEGARAVNPDIRVIQNYVGVTDAAWNNPGKGKELALAQLSKGADVIFTAAGNSGLGAFDAVEQYGMKDGRAKRFVIGVDSNQNGLKPGFVLTSMVKRVDNAVYKMVEDLVNGQFKAGIHIYGLPEDGIGYAMDEFNAPLISQEIIDQVEEAKRKIINGQIEVTDAMAR